MPRAYRFPSTCVISVIMLLQASAIVSAQESRTETGIQPAVFRSGDTLAQRAYDWAKSMAISYRGNPADPVGPWYEAALPSRNAFCMRDVSHQCIGAEILGMSAENRNMFLWFNKSISESKDWCSYWEIDKEARPAPVDYKNDREFWYNLNANFDVLYAQWRLYEWTGDNKYINDPAFVNFRERTLDDYIRRWTLQPDSLTLRPAHPNAPVPFDPNNGFHASRGIPSYSEGAGELIMGVDLVASMYRTMLTYSSIAAQGGKQSVASRYRQEAERYKAALENNWWDSADSLYYTYFNSDKHFGKEEGETFLLWFDALTDPFRLQRTLAHIASKKWNAENTSYLPLLFYRYGQWSQAKEYLRFLSDPSTPRREYPEVSYGVVDGIVQGLMGISPSATNRSISTMLRDTSNQLYSVSNLQVLGTSISVIHHGRSRSTITNDGNEAFTWIACFAGSFNQGTLNGKKVRLRQKQDASGTISYCNVIVPAGATMQVMIKAN